MLNPSILWLFSLSSVLELSSCIKYGLPFVSSWDNTEGAKHLRDLYIYARLILVFMKFFRSRQGGNCPLSSLNSLAPPLPNIDWVHKLLSWARLTKHKIIDTMVDPNAWLTPNDGRLLCEPLYMASLLVVSFMIYLTFIHADISRKTYSVWSMIITLYYQAKIPIGRQNTLLVELIEIHTPLI